MQYDNLNRLTSIVSRDWNPSTLNYQLSTETKYLYDGWNLIAELDADGTLMYSHIWGLDAGGTMQWAGLPSQSLATAGGVGGLLWITDQSTISNQPSTHFYCYDGNGNVVALVSAADGSVTAQYEYDAFGGTVRETGPMAEANPMGFSSQYTDKVTRHLHYLYRVYDPETGRWLSSDPINETGFELIAAIPRNPQRELIESTQAVLDEVQTLFTHLPRIKNTDEHQTGPAYVLAMNNPVILFDVLGLDCPACDSGIGTYSIPISSDGGLRCCAEHDSCFDQNNGTAASWGSTIVKLDQMANGFPVEFTPCEQCNVSVLRCMVSPPSNGPKYYCAKQHRFISIPGDFSDLPSAKCACCN